MLKRVFISALLLVVFSVGATLLFVRRDWFLGAMCVLLAVVLMWLLILEYRRNATKLTYILDAFDADDLAFRFSGAEGDSYNRMFNRSLNRIRDILERERETVQEQEKYFGLMLDNVNTGVIAVRNNGVVDYCNHKTLELFGLSILTHIIQLARVDETLPERFERFDAGDETKVSILNERGQTHLSIVCSRAEIKGEKIRIFAVNDIGSEIESSELESWSKLIRVLTHEIMNTVTPIASLSETLSSYYGRNSKEVNDGLKVISNSCRGLISFVESYRNLTKIPVPVRTGVYVAELIRKNITLLGEQLADAGVDCRFSTSDESIMIFADENMISQVVINILKNAVQAGASEIRIDSHIESQENVVIGFANNGTPISRESGEQIFIPFYTTKSSGTGIGLSLSRQIMRLHDGAIKMLRSNERETVFVLIFK